jgi:hypothetical protein
LKILLGTVASTIFKASLETTISQGISILPWENELISLGKIEIPWEIVVSKLALRECPCDYSLSIYFHATVWETT